MSAVDVLAVMRRDAVHALEHRCDCPSLRDGAIAKQVESIEARAAVAELIEAGQRALALLDDEDLGDYMSAEMLRAALARVGGAK